VELTPKQQLQVWKAWIKRWSELTIEEIDRDIVAIDRADPFTELFLAARWAETGERLAESNVSRTDALRADEIVTREDLQERWQLMCKHFGVGTSSQLPIDVNQTLDWMKQRVARDYEQTVRKAIDNHQVTSPIEQLFLMEWHYQRAGETCRVTLHPQERVKTDAGTYSIDFVVRSTVGNESRGTLAIELDGHDFHEKTKEQVAKDKKRERAIVKAGLPILRFSGYEIWTNARACVLEVTEYFRA
jgi:very-short-patch-repair endonuclease